MKLLTRTQAQEFIDRCERENVRVVGIEGFRRQGESIVPDMDAIADFSEFTPEDTIALACHHARMFLNLMPPDLLFEFELSG